MHEAPWHSRWVCSFCVECEVYAAIWVEIVYKDEICPMNGRFRPAVPPDGILLPSLNRPEFGNIQNKAFLLYLFHVKYFHGMICARWMLDFEPAVQKYSEFLWDIAKELRIRINIYKLGSGSGLFPKNQFHIHFPLKIVVIDFLIFNI